MVVEARRGKGRTTVAGAGRGRRADWYVGVVFALLLGLTLVACGDDEDDDGNEADTRNDDPAVSSISDASPAAGTPGRGGLAQDADTVTVEIKDGKLDPETVSGTVGLPFIMTVRGDGSAHVLDIQDLVADYPIAADGETPVQFTVAEGSEGDKDILLDGEEAGTFRSQDVGGISE